jgi:hypothetical protein
MKLASLVVRVAEGGGAASGRPFFFFCLVVVVAAFATIASIAAFWL